MSATNGYQTSGDVLVDGLMLGLNQSGRSNTENFLALARVVMWCSMFDLDNETHDMGQAKELMRNGALMFDRAVKHARINANDEYVD